jgi:hypothetical protein
MPEVLWVYASSSSGGINMPDSFRAWVDLSVSDMRSMLITLVGYILVPSPRLASSPFETAESRIYRLHRGPKQNNGERRRSGPLLRMRLGAPTL